MKTKQSDNKNKKNTKNKNAILKLTKPQNHIPWIHGVGYTPIATSAPNP